jgi:hypothetical protein
MIKEGHKKFFLDRIYNNKSNTIRSYNIVIHAETDPLFDNYDTTTLSSIEKDDIKIKFSVCQFFVEEKGCGLPPQFKTDICRSFICTTIEDQLSDENKEQLTRWVKGIKQETSEFNIKHQDILSTRGMNLMDQLHDVMDYLEQVEE